MVAGNVNRAACGLFFRRVATVSVYRGADLLKWPVARRQPQRLQLGADSPKGKDS
jgi:hypothetical protein